MKFKINWVKDDFEDSQIVEGETEKECQDKAVALMERIKPQEIWSEFISD